LLRFTNTSSGITAKKMIAITLNTSMYASACDCCCTSRFNGAGAVGEKRLLQLRKRPEVLRIIRRNVLDENILVE